MPGVLALLRDVEPTQVVPQLALDEQADPLLGTYKSYRGIQSAVVERDGAALTMTLDGYTGGRTLQLQPTSLDPDNHTFRRSQPPAIRSLSSSRLPSRERLTCSFSAGDYTTQSDHSLFRPVVTRLMPVD